MCPRVQISCVSYRDYRTLFALLSIYAKWPRVLVGTWEERRAWSRRAWAYRRRGMSPIWLAYALIVPNHPLLELSRPYRLLVSGHPIPQRRRHDSGYPREGEGWLEGPESGREEKAVSLLGELVSVTCCHWAVVTIHDSFYFLIIWIETKPRISVLLHYVWVQGRPWLLEDVPRGMHVHHFFGSRLLHLHETLRYLWLQWMIIALFIT